MHAVDTLLPPTATRVEEVTSAENNARIEQETVTRLTRLLMAGPAAITARLEELDREWDIERTLEAHAAAVTLVTLGLGFTVNRKWLAMPAVVAGFLLQHALQGWCPPLPVFRLLGIRTAREIDTERLALRILRGDFARATRVPGEAMDLAQEAH